MPGPFKDMIGPFKAPPHYEPTWTAQDEEDFQKKTSRRSLVLSKNEDKLHSVVVAIFSKNGARQMQIPELAAIFIEKASEIREALKPYEELKQIR